MDPDQKVTGRYQVIIADWSHSGGLDRGIELQWYDTWTKGVDTGLPTHTRTPLHLQELVSNRWVNATTYPIVEAYTTLFLAPGALLSGLPDEVSEDTLTWVPPGETGTVLEYTSEPFDDGGMLAGPIAAQLDVTSSNANAQLLIELLDVAPDGATATITHASILASRRATDPAKSWTDDDGFPIRPYLALDRDDPLTPGEPVQLNIPLQPTLWSIEPAHRLTVRISTQPASEQCVLEIGRPPWGCMLTQPMLDTLPGGHYTIDHGGALASSIGLPLLGQGDLRTARATITETTSDRSTLPLDW